MRLDRFLANASAYSRSDIARLLKQGAVAIDGEVVRSGASQIEPDRLITLHGCAIAAPQPIYLMMHKPVGYVCANADNSHPTVLDLVHGNPLATHPTEPLQIVGRLDQDTSGLLFLTTDGQWNHHITAPKSRCTKTYQVSLAEPIGADAIHKITAGLLLKSETKPTLPCSIQQKSATEVEITLSEGRYHQVKRLFAAVGNRVTQLHRSQIGNIALDTQLAAGDIRPLSDAERLQL